MNNLMKYSRLTEIYKAVKPYRNTDQYPYYDRNHRHKYFIAKEVNGKVEFHIGYGWGWNWVHMSADDFHKNKGFMSKRELSKWSMTHDGKTFESIQREPRYLGIVRDDNTFEFNISPDDKQDEYHQGDRYILSGGGGYFQKSCRHGGCVYIQRNGYKWSEKEHWSIMPIFKGLRVDMDTMKPIAESEYKILTKRVDRQKAKLALADYKPSFDLCEAMYKVLDNKTFVEDFISVIREYKYIRESQSFGDENEQYRAGKKWWRAEGLDKLQAIAMDKFKDEPMTASYLMLKGMHLFGINYLDEDEPNPRLSEYYKPVNYFNSFKQYMIKQLYLASDTFKYAEEHMPNKLKASRWETKIIVNNNVVKQY